MLCKLLWHISIVFLLSSKETADLKNVQVTNKAVLEAAPRGDDAHIQASSEQTLNQEMSRGKAYHGEVLEASQEAAADIEVDEDIFQLSFRVLKPI